MRERERERERKKRRRKEGRRGEERGGREGKGNERWKIRSMFMLSIDVYVDKRVEDVYLGHVYLWPRLGRRLSMVAAPKTVECKAVFN